MKKTNKIISIILSFIAILSATIGIGTFLKNKTYNNINEKSLSNTTLYIEKKDNHSYADLLKKMNTTKNSIIQNQKQMIMTFFKEKNSNQLEQMRKNLINSIDTDKVGNRVVNNQILDTKIWNKDMIKFLTSSNFEINNERIFNAILYDDDHIINLGQLTQQHGLEAHTHWYWFGYWRLYIGHDSVDDVQKAIWDDGGIPDLIAKWSDAYPPLAAAIAVVVPLLVANHFILELDRGNGVWIGLWAVVPDLGWGPL